MPSCMPSTWPCATAELAENPDRPIWTEPVMIGHLREPTKDELVEAWAVFEDDTPGATLFGGGFIFFPQLDNLEKAYTGLSIAPQHQRNGAGSAVLEQLVSRAAAHGRTTVLLESQYGFDRRDDHGYRRFAERHGFALASVEVSRRMPLPVPEEQLQEWIDEAAPHHRDYRIETFEEIPGRAAALGLLRRQPARARRADRRHRVRGRADHPRDPPRVTMRDSRSGAASSSRRSRSTRRARRSR